MPAAYLRGPEVPPVTVPYAFGCTGKVRQSRFQAVAVQARRGRRGSVGRQYECGACGCWHTTHLRREMRNRPEG